MTDTEKELFEYQSQYLNLLHKLTQFKLSGEPLPEELVKKAQELGRVANNRSFKILSEPSSFHDKGPFASLPEAVTLS